MASYDVASTIDHSLPPGNHNMRGGRSGPDRRQLLPRVHAAGPGVEFPGLAADAGRWRQNYRGTAWQKFHNISC